MAVDDMLPEDLPPLLKAQAAAPADAKNSKMATYEAIQSKLGDKESIRRELEMLKQLVSSHHG
ncbi:hypothetical protein HK101_004316, partial [Irineochytrium annulatum]